MIAEYGADTIAGLHRDPSFMFTEDFQVEFLAEYHKVFDTARKENLVGEMVWNFADFMTVQGEFCITQLTEKNHSVGIHLLCL